MSERTLTESTSAPEGDGTKRPQTRVRLCLWGATDRDVDGAAANVRYHPDVDGWDICGTEQTVSRCTTIARNDPQALAQRAGYGWAWAIYPARQDP